MAENSFVQSSYPSANGRDTVACYVWTPTDRPPCAVVQLSHGMQEYARRYAPLAEFLCTHGYAVAGNDHLGHGATAASADDLGFTGEGGADAMIADVHTMTERLREQFPGLPIILLGHSMGSFIARNVAAAFGGDYAGMIFSGTGGPEMPTGAGRMLARWRMFRRGERYRSQLIAKVAFGNYNRRYDAPVTKKSWISRDEAVVKAYMADPFCNYAFTARGWYDLFDLLGRVSARDWAAKLPADLPILLASGTMDPVGNFGRGVEEVYRRLEKAGVRDLTIKLYPDARHEILNETNRSEVYADMLAWLNAHVGKEQSDA
ncbi:MAG: lysophospholipase [Clostridia bacterium]|nr:lysophospholipase [Clostridia bacterium]